MKNFNQNCIVFSNIYQNYTRKIEWFPPNPVKYSQLTAILIGQTGILIWAIAIRVGHSDIAFTLFRVKSSLSASH